MDHDVHQVPQVAIFLRSQRLLAGAPDPWTRAETMCRRFALHHGMNVVGVYRDEPAQNEWTALLVDAADGQFDTVLTDVLANLEYPGMVYLLARERVRLLAVDAENTLERDPDLTLAGMTLDFAGRPPLTPDPAPALRRGDASKGPAGC